MRVGDPRWPFGLGLVDPPAGGTTLEKSDYSRRKRCCQQRLTNRLVTRFYFTGFGSPSTSGWLLLALLPSGRVCQFFRDAFQRLPLHRLNCLYFAQRLNVDVRHDQIPYHSLEDLRWYCVHLN